MIRRATFVTILLLSATPLQAQQQTLRSAAGNLSVETIASGLANPWSLAFLPDGRMLVTEKRGQLRIVGRDGKLSEPVAGMPPVRSGGQGGLHDVTLDRGFAENRTIYWCFANEAGGGGQTALARGQLTDAATPRLDDVKVIFRQEGPLSGGNHYGCRIAQARDGNLFLTMGDHFAYRDQAQNLSNHIGKIVRVTPDGGVPNDNPFVGRAGAKPEIWSYGHRNAQGAAIHPQSGKLWETEHGPRGGDELNIPEAGKNYGWPVIGYGINYDGTKAHETTHKGGMEQPIKQWTPVIAASGMAFYQGDLFPAWKGNLFLGGLAGKGGCPGRC